jgi:Flp pilus assembly protein TadG
MALELAIMTPVLVALFIALVAVGRVVDVKGRLDGAARDAARAAAVARDPGMAQTLADRAVTDTMAGTSWCVDAPTVQTDVGHWGPGGFVSVTVTCSANLNGLGLSGLAPAVTRTGRATSPIDTYRRTVCAGGQVCDQPGAG